MQAVTVVEKRASQGISEAISAIIQDPTLISREMYVQLRMEIIRDLVRDSANDAHVKLFSEIQLFEERNPAERFVTQYFVDSWLQAHGMRMIQDKSVSESIRQQCEEQEKKQSSNRFVKAVRAFLRMDESTRTTLILQNEALAANNEAIKRESEKIDAQSRERLAQAEKALLDARTHASDLITKAGEKTVQMIAEASRLAEQNKAELNKAMLEQERRVKQLQELEVQLREVPYAELLFQLREQLHALKQDTRKKEYEARCDRFMTRIISLYAQHPRGEGTGHYLDNNPTFVEAIRIFVDECLMDLVTYRREYSKEEFSKYAAKYDLLIDACSSGNGKWTHSCVSYPQTAFLCAVNAVRYGSDESKIREIFLEKLDTLVNDFNNPDTSTLFAVKSYFTPITSRLKQLVQAS